MTVVSRPTRIVPASARATSESRVSVCPVGAGLSVPTRSAVEPETAPAERQAVEVGGLCCRGDHARRYRFPNGALLARSNWSSWIRPPRQTCSLDQETDSLWRKFARYAGHAAGLDSRPGRCERAGVGVEQNNQTPCRQTTWILRLPRRRKERSSPQQRAKSARLCGGSMRRGSWERSRD